MKDLGTFPATLAASIVVLAGCQDTAGQPLTAPTSTSPTTAIAVPTPAARPPAAGTGGCQVGQIGTVEAGSVLVPGPREGLPRSTATGDPLVIVGVVLDARCQPAADASVHLWHADARGAYGPAAEQCCYYEGTVHTDARGRFRLNTIRPGQYPQPNAPPAHIHVHVRHATGQLTAEIVFAGDPGVPATAGRSGLVPVALTRQERADKAWHGEATLVLSS